MYNIKNGERKKDERLERRVFEGSKSVTKIEQIVLEGDTC